MEPYRTRYAQASLSLPETERLAAKVLCLPTGTAVGQAEISAICQIIQFLTREGNVVRKQMLTQSLRRHPLKSYF
jgi:dTDP-4-amino-4,6-dideoxygalactose transaminase